MSNQNLTQSTPNQVITYAHGPAHITGPVVDPLTDEQVYRVDALDPPASFYVSEAYATRLLTRFLPRL